MPTHSARPGRLAMLQRGSFIDLALAAMLQGASFQDDVQQETGA